MNVASQKEEDQTIFEQIRIFSLYLDVIQTFVCVFLQNVSCDQGLPCLHEINWKNQDLHNENFNAA